MKSAVSPSVALLTTFLLVMAGGIQFVVLPQMHQLATERAQWTTISNESVSHTLSAADQQKLTASGAVVDRLLPVTDNQYDLSVQIQGLVQNLGLTLTGLSTGSGTTSASSATSATGAATSGLSNVPFTLGVTAQYSDLPRLLAGLVSLDRLVQIDQISVNASAATTTTPGASATTNSGLLNIQVVGFAYYLPATTPTTATK